MSKLRDFWDRRSWKGKTLIIGGAILVLLVLIGDLACSTPRTQTVASVATTSAPLTSSTEAPTTTMAPATTVAPTTTEPPTITTAAAGFAVELLRVVDGDTIVVTMPDGSEEKVRYIGMDTPESTTQVEAYGKEASAYNARLLESGPLRIETDVQERDKYGRLLAYVWAGDVFINRRLVLDGYAQVATYPPNVKHEATFLDAQQKARTALAGLWAPTTTTTIAPQPEEPDTGDGDVYVTNTGEKYHREDCRYLKSKIPISLVDAKAQGYEPCKVCSPPQ